MFHGSETARKVIARLQSEKSDLLRDDYKLPEKKSLTLDENREMTPAEINKMTKRIALKREGAPGLDEDETAALLKRIGLGRRA